MVLYVSKDDATKTSINGKPVIEKIEINLNRDVKGMDLLLHDIVIVGETNKKVVSKHTWITSSRSDVAMRVRPASLKL